MESQLSLNDLGVVQEAMFPARAKWYNIGLMLSVEVATLESIKKKYPVPDPSDQLREALKAWLESSKGVTWMVLVEALKTRTVGESQLGASLEQQHCSKSTADTQAMTGSGRRGREESQYPVPRPKRSKGIPKYNDGQAHDQQCQVENNSECLEDQEGMILDLKSRVEMIDQHIRELKELIKEQAQQLQEVHHKLEATNQEQVEAVEPTAIQQLTPDIQSSPTLLGSEQKRPGTKLRLRWEKCRKAPECIAPVNVFLVSTDGSTCTCTCTHNQTAYFSASQSVYAYNSKMDKWIDLPDNPYYHFSLASINDKLTTIGGSVGLDRSNVTNSLLCLTGNGFSMKWSESFPPMPTKRCRTVIVYSSPSLIVAGGVNSDQDVYIIEVMNTDSLQWFTAGSLPHQYPLNSGMAYTMCRDRLYVLKCNYRTRSILTCLVTELLQSSQVVWKEFKAPVVGVAMVSLCEQLLAVGGIEADEEASAAIHAYDPETNTWELISRMPTARGCPLVAVLPSNRLMVVGGVEYKKIICMMKKRAAM